MTDFLDLAANFGPWAAMAIFLVWWMLKNQKVITEKLDMRTEQMIEQNDKYSKKLIEMHGDQSAVIAANTNVMQKNIEVQEKTQALLTEVTVELNLSRAHRSHTPE